MSEHLSLYARCHRAAVIYIVQTIEREAIPCAVDGERWYDVSPLLNPNEYAGKLLDLNREIVGLGLELGVLGPHPRRKHIVHINAAG